MVRVDDFRNRGFDRPRSYAVAHKNLAIRFDSTSGGAFSALAKVVYGRKGFVGGAVRKDDFSVANFISDKRIDLSRLRSSCMFACLQKYINKYRGFIVGLSPLTNVMVVNLTKEIMPALTEEVVRWQLQVMIGFVYAYHALLGSSRIAFQEYFTKLSKRLI